MSSALKSAITPPAGPQNPAVPPQINKPMHPQGSTPPTYGQPMSHIPQNLVNIPHNPPAHSGSLPNHNTNSAVHPPNHYSLNVPNASQHYGAAAAHSAVSSNNHGLQSNPGAPSPSTFNINPPKNPPYGAPTFQPSSGLYVNKSPPPPPQQPSQAPTNLSDTACKLPHSNGTEEKGSKQSTTDSDSILDVPQNYCTTKDKVPSTAPNSQPVSIPTADKDPSSSVVPHEDKKTSNVLKKDEMKEKSLPTETPTVSSTSESVTPSVSSNETEKSLHGTPQNVSVPTNAATSLGSTPVTPTESSQGADAAVNSSTVTTPTKSKDQVNNQKSPMKLATTPRSMPRKTKSDSGDSTKTTPKNTESKSSNQVQKSPTSIGKVKRNRIPTQPYQCPLPEVELISKISATTPKNKNTEERLIVFYKNEFLAVRNSEGGFYICQAVQNIYKSSHRIKIRWLSQDKTDKEIYIPDFYDHTDFDCILTNLNLTRLNKDRYKLPPKEKVRTDSILKRAIDVEKGEAVPPSPTEEHPDGLDVSLYKEESQLKKTTKRKASAPLDGLSTPSTSSTKSPDKPKVRKIIPKTPLAKKAKVLKKALSAKVTNVKSTPPERSSRRRGEPTLSPSPTSTKSSPVIDQKKAKVLAKVARKSATPAKATKAPAKTLNKRTTTPIKKVTSAPSQPTTSSAKKEKPTVTVTRKSKRGKK